MNFRLCRAILFLCLTPLNAVAGEQLTIIHAGQLLAVPGQQVLDEQSILISDGKIVGVVPGYLETTEVDASYTQVSVLDLADQFVMPGLIDLHVHITMEPRPGEHLRVVTESAADLALTGAQHAKLTLEAGFTTIVDLGRPGTPGHETAVFALRDAIAAGKVPGPGILATGSPLSSTSQSRRPLFRDEVEQVVGALAVCDGADACRRAVREQIRKGADIISFYSSGSLLFPEPVGQAMTDGEMRAIVETAHSLGRKVIADGHHAPGIAAAIRAGVDSVDSIHMATDKTLQLILDSGTYMQSHIYAVVAAVGDTRETVHDGVVWWHPTSVLERLFDIKMRPFAVARAYQAGIRQIALATDAGNFPHGDNARDVVEYVKRGIPEMFALKAATVNAAEMLGLLDTIGTIEPGKQADIIATGNSPLDDISEVTRVRFVMRDGKVYLDN
jgi:imidazolonepropionase-like amidohydrolase